jgi:hypothetical protein
LGMTVLAAVLEPLAEQRRVSMPWLSTNIAGYLDRMNFFKGLTVEGVNIPPSRNRNDQRSNLLEITSNSHFDFLIGSEAGLRSRNFQTWSYPSQRSPIVWVRPGADRCAERPVGLLGAAPSIPGVSWRVLAFERRTQQTQGRNNAQPRLVACLRLLAIADDSPIRHPSCIRMWRVTGVWAEGPGS